MKRGRTQEEHDSQDSFLDVVANVVGVLIILVMLVGMQASRGLLSAQVADAEQAPEKSAAIASSQPSSADQLDRLKQEVKLARKDALKQEKTVSDLATKVTRLSIESSSHDEERVELAMHREAIQQEIERRRQNLSEQDQESFDVQQALLKSKLELESLNQERIVLASAPEEVEEIECVPTPMAREMDIPSIHLRLRNGLVSIVPVEPLLDELRVRSGDIVRRLQLSSKVVETAGPIEGYRARAVFVKQARRPIGGTTVGNRTQYELDTYTEFLPMSAEIGQNVEQALLPGSKLINYLESKRRDSPPVDVWLYTDSFDEFRTLKKALWEMGFAISTRPLRPGDKIGASPHGTKSAAQ